MVRDRDTEEAFRAGQEVGPERAVEAERPVEQGGAEPDDLTTVKGIGAAMQERLRALGIATFRDLAMADAEELTAELKAGQVVISKRRVNEWIEAARQRA